MALPTSEVRELVQRLADRRVGRAEANVQSDLHMLLAAGPLDLGEDKIEDITLESPAGQLRRIDVEVGFTVFEVKRDLRTGNVRADAVKQLAGYVMARAGAMQQRYAGKSFQALRQQIRRALTENGVAAKIEELVAPVLSSAPAPGN